MKDYVSKTETLFRPAFAQNHMENNIRRWRVARGLSQEELGRRVGLSKASISKLERGGVRLRDVTIARLVEALDVPAEALLGDYAGAAHPAETEKAETGKTAAETRETHFGFRRVAIDEKRRLVQGVFSRVAADYDLMNDLMSGGIHRLWKNEMVAWLRPRAGMTVADVAGGTGDIAFRIIDRARRAQAAAGSRAGAEQSAAREAGARVVVVDANPDMLAVGRARGYDRGLCAGLDWVCGDAEALPLADRSVDAYTIAFGIRNVPRIEAALSEARRVLRPGGRFLCLEFSRVVLPGLDRLYDAYSFAVLPALGAVVAGDRDAYQYLVESIRRFPDQETFAEMIRKAGLGAVRFRNLSGGIAAIHSAWRV